MNPMDRRAILTAPRLAALLAGTLTIAGLVVGCGSGGGIGPLPTIATPTPAPTASGTAGSAVSKSINGAAGGSLTIPGLSSGQLFNVVFAPNSFSGTSTITVTPLTEAQLAVPLKSAKLPGASRFTPSANNKFLFGFTLTASGGVANFNPGATITGSGFVTFTAGTVLAIAKQSGNTYVDLATLVIGRDATISTQLLSTALPGITGPGTYVIYQQDASTSTLVSNLGVAIISDDGSGNVLQADGSVGNGIQVVHLYDATGKPLATPTIDSLPYANASDLDGAALTPDGSQGILVDGGNTVRFFSGVNTGTTTASATTLDVSAYGGDGDSVAIMPTGDTAIVSADGDMLLAVSGIKSGNPQPAFTINIPNNRDGVIISNDGKVMLARGTTGLTVFSIAAVTPSVGALGGNVDYAFTQTTDIPTLGAEGLEDGRDGMAFSPSDSTRAVVISSASQGIDLVTGLPGNPVTRSLKLNVPASRSAKQAAPRNEPSGRATLVPTGVSGIYSVAITPDGKYAVVGCDAGIILVSGVDTGTLAQVGTVPFSPTYTNASGTATALSGVRTLGITLDSKYVAVIDGSQGTLLTIPITPTAASGFSAPVGQVNGVSTPNNDQLLIH